MVHHTFVVAPASGPICDFCSCRPVTARYTAKTFELHPGAFPLSSLHQMSVGDWAACSDCEKMLDANDWEGIVARAVFYFFKHHPEIELLFTGTALDNVKKQMRAEFWNLYRQLRENELSKAESAGYD